jgi:hypothetical protein
MLRKILVAIGNTTTTLTITTTLHELLRSSRRLCALYFGHSSFWGLISTDSFTTVIFQGTQSGDGINFDNLSFGHANANPNAVLLPAALRSSPPVSAR